MMFVDALLPRTLERTASRLGTVFVTLAVLAAVFFPASAIAGTEVTFTRWITAGTLAAGGIGLHLTSKRGALSLVVLVLVAIVAAMHGTRWLLVFDVAAVVYAVAAWVRERRGGGVEPEFEEEPHLHAAEMVRDQAEAIAMALILALTVREFVYEAFQIPTKSMQPTILGQDLAADRKWGDRLLASKWPMLSGDPPRWSIVVFKYPLFRPINYIKRLIGLPGETVAIRGGDIYVNGVIAPKPDAVQASLWFPVRNPEDSHATQAFEAQDGAAEWTFEEDHIAADAEGGVFSSVKLLGVSRTPDMRVEVDVEPSRLGDDAAFRMTIDARRRHIELEVDAEGMWLTAPGVERQIVADFSLDDAPARIGLSAADRVARVYVDGRVVAKVQHEDTTNDGAEREAITLGLRGVAAELGSVSVDRDLQYNQSREWVVPDDHYIVLGDNTISSKDSRMWEVTVLELSDGRTLEGEHSVKLEDGTIVPFDDSGDEYRFLDTNGVARRVPKSDVVKVTERVDRPFVKRNDLVGRAFLVFFPFPPFGDFRPHILP